MYKKKIGVHSPKLKVTTKAKMGGDDSHLQGINVRKSPLQPSKKNRSRR